MMPAASSCRPAGTLEHLGSRIKTLELLDVAAQWKGITACCSDDTANVDVKLSQSPAAVTES